MSEFIDLTGKTFGRLKVLEISDRLTKYYNGKKVYVQMWKCLCTCGNIVYVSGKSLRRGNTRSCGCLMVDKVRETRTKHGKSRSRLYMVWIGMKERCYNANHIGYQNYGGRGIKVCDRWRKDFKSFYDDMIRMGYSESDTGNTQTLDRIDVDGDYEPKNCRLIPIAEQSLNKRINRLFTYKGVTKTLSEFAKEYKIDYETLRRRIDEHSYSIEEALTKPVRKCPHKNAPVYKVNGIEKNFREWANFFGITRDELKAKTRRKSVVDAIKELLDEM